MKKSPRKNENPFRMNNPSWREPLTTYGRIAPKIIEPHWRGPAGLWSTPRKRWGASGVFPRYAYWMKILQHKDEYPFQIEKYCREDLPIYVRKQRPPAMDKPRHMAVLWQHLTFYDLNKYYNAGHQNNRNSDCRQILPLNIAVIPGRKLFHPSDAFQQTIPGINKSGWLNNS